VVQGNEGDIISSWSFHNPTRIIFGEDSVESIGGIIGVERAVLVTSPGFRKRGLVKRIEELMNGRIARVLDTVTPNPNLDDIDALRFMDGLDEVDSIIALGGGSSIDTAKALSRIMTSSRDEPLSDHFWKGPPPGASATVPIIAIPTTAGTGSEVTSTATIWNHQKGAKHSLCGDDLYPRTAIVDPVQTYDLPESVTVSCGLDAISHAFESIWNRNASPMSTVLATQSLRMSLDALPRLKTNGHDIQARSSMMQASLMAGLAISQTRTALSHSLSYPLTIELGIPHGIACSFALPEILEFNAAADDGRLETLVIELGYGTISRLGNELRSLLELSLSSTDSLNGMSGRTLTIDLKKRMFTRGRMDNNLRSVELNDLDPILSKALDRYGVQ